MSSESRLHHINIQDSRHRLVLRWHNVETSVLIRLSKTIPGKINKVIIITSVLIALFIKSTSRMKRAAAIQVTKTVALLTRLILTSRQQLRPHSMKGNIKIMKLFFLSTKPPNIFVGEIT